MPFFTEHLWHKASNTLKNDTTKINKSEWPKGIHVDEKDNKKIKVLLELISSIRSTRSEMNVPANAVIDINYSKISNELGTIFDQHKETIQSLTRSKSITEKNFSKDEGMVQVIFNDGLIYLSLKGIIDFEQEKNRLQKSLLKIEKEMNKIEIKLKSENFTQNAPAEIIAEQKNRYKEYELSKEKIEVAIKSLG